MKKLFLLLAFLAMLSPAQAVYKIQTPRFDFVPLFQDPLKNSNDPVVVANQGNPHLRIRTIFQNAITRVRHTLAMVSQQFFDEHGSSWISTTIITSLESEGAGDRVENVENPPANFLKKFCVVSAVSVLNNHNPDCS